MNEIVLRLIEEKKKIDIKGLLEAERNGNLLQYLADDLLKLGIDPKTISIPVKKFKSKKSNVSNSFTSFEEFVDKASDFLDTKLNEPYFASHSGQFEKSISNRLSNLGTFDALNCNLKIIKVISASVSIICSAFFLGQLGRINIFKSLFLGFVAYDCMKISSNCYLKAYLCQVAKKYTGNLRNVGETVFQWAQSALGIGNQDPFEKLKEQLKGEIEWDIVLLDTVSEKILNQVKLMSKK